MLDNQADPETKPKIILQKPIRTYESDVAEALANRKSNIASMVIAEKKKDEQEAESISTSVKSGTSSSNSKKVFMLLVSIIFIVTGLGGGYYLYLKSPLSATPSTSNIVKVPSLINPDIQKRMEIASMNGEKLEIAIANSFNNENVKDNQINEIILTQNTGSTTYRILGNEFIKKMNWNMPETLVRSITNKWMLGVYGYDGQKLPFIVLSTDFFQNAFAGMLKWENSIPDELSVILNYKDIARANDNTSTSSIKSFFSIRGNYVDRVIMNRDVREFRSESGELLVLYSFIDKDMFIIATSEATLKALIEKIEKQTYLR